MILFLVRQIIMKQGYVASMENPNNRDRMQRNVTDDKKRGKIPRNQAFLPNAWLNDGI